MSNFVKLEQQLLAHNLQGTDFPSILLLCQENLTITTLTDLCEDLEIALAKTYTALAKVGTLSTSILLPDGLVGFFGSSRWLRELGLEVVESSLPLADISQKVKVVVQKI